jgi:hypothetical protein
MMQLLLNIPSGLQERVIPLARETNETAEQLALRLLEEYVDDCEEADRISSEIDAGIMPTYSLQEVKENLGMDS